MRAVVQRVSKASFTVEGEIISKIGLGLSVCKFSLVQFDINNAIVMVRRYS
jgi:D-Tyr-tRNAtyr deacylase